MDETRSVRLGGLVLDDALGVVGVLCRGEPVG